MKEKFIIGFLKGFASLPLGVLYLFSDFAYFILYHLLDYRKNIVRKNLSTSFPEKNQEEIRKIEKEFYHYLADQMVETLKVFKISEKEMARRVKVEGYDKVNMSLEKGRNAVLFMGHYGNWEWVQEITRYFLPSAFMCSLYMPLSSKLWDNIFKKLRNRWKAHIIPSNMAPRTLLNKNNFPWVCGFIADQRPGVKQPQNCIEFLNHTTYFAYGTEEIGRKTDADFFYLEMLRPRRGYYEIKFHRLSPEDVSVTYPFTRQFWKMFEQTIRKNPPYWLWSHNRWK